MMVCGAFHLCEKCIQGVMEIREMLILMWAWARKAYVICCAHGGEICVMDIRNIVATVVV